MTAEHLTLLEPRDVRAIRIVCTRCRSALTLQLEETIHVPEACPVCREDWDRSPSGATPVREAEMLARAFKLWRSPDRNHIPFVVQLEILTPRPTIPTS
jgi:hypothetical protein